MNICVRDATHLASFSKCVLLVLGFSFELFSEICLESQFKISEFLVTFHCFVRVVLSC